jgi:hypothetical protein
MDRQANMVRRAIWRKNKWKTLTHRKDLVKGDILIDDRPNN